MATGTAEHALGTKENPLREEDAPPKGQEEGDAKKTVSAHEVEQHQGEVRSTSRALKAPSADAVIPIAEFTLNVLQKIVEGIIDVPRKIAIGLKNYTDYKLQFSGLYFESGTSDTNLPYEVGSQMVGLWGGRKSQSTARGTVGVYSYKILNQNKTIMVMWSVPFDYNLYSNWWSATVVNGYQEADSSTYNNMYNGSNGMPYPWQANGWKSRDANGFKILGSMTNNGQSLLEIELK